MDDAGNNYWVDVIGFNPTERHLLASIFGLAARRDPGFLQREPNSAQGADLYLVDVDNDQAFAEYQALSSRHDAPAVLVGGSNRGTGLPLIARPMQWARLLRAFDDAVTPQQPEPSTDDYEKTLLVRRTTTNTLGYAVTQPPLGATQQRLGATQPHLGATQPNLGATRPSLGATRPPGGAPAQSAPPRVPPPAAARGKQITDSVLVVDDNATVRKFMEAKLAPYGFHVDFAETGEEAVGLTGTNEYTCVFLDVVLPGIDGYQVCKLIKSNKQAIKRTAVVMLTGRTGRLDKLRGSMAGCDAYLTKPVDENNLLEVIAKFLPSSRAAGG